jgi:transcription initiation factor TFIIF subunit beta
MNGLKQDPDVKMDHDAITPSGSGYMDDDFYEDTGELSLPKKGVEKDVWVTRIPKWLYEAVSKYEDVADGRDDDQIVIGEVLAMRDPSRPGQLSKTDPMRLFLNNRSVAEKKLPQAFELKMTPASQEVLGNTYVFTEKDLPGFKPTGFGPGRGPGGSFGYGIQDPKAKVQKRSKYRKAIPSKLVEYILYGSFTDNSPRTNIPNRLHNPRIQRNPPPN